MFSSGCSLCWLSIYSIVAWARVLSPNMDVWDREKGVSSKEVLIEITVDILKLRDYRFYNCWVCIPWIYDLLSRNKTCRFLKAPSLGKLRTWAPQADVPYTAVVIFLLVGQHPPAAEPVFFKGQCHEIFDHFFGLKDSAWARMNSQKRFREIFRFHGDFQSRSSKIGCLRSRWISCHDVRVVTDNADTCPHSCWLRWHSVRVVVDYADTMSA